MPDNIYRFRRIKWREPQKFGGMPGSNGPRKPRGDLFGIAIGVIVVGALLYLTN